MFDPALTQLTRLLSIAAFRRVWRQVKTPSGAILTLAMLFMVLVGIGPSIAMAILNPEIGGSSLFQSMADVIPLLLYALTTAGIVLDVGKTFLELMPAELQFVLAGPFTDRQILSYRLRTKAIGWIPVSLFFSLLMLPYTGSYIGTVLAVMLGGSLVMLLAILFTLAKPRLSPAILTVIRSLLLIGLAVMVAEGMSIYLNSAESFSISGLGKSIEGSWTASVLLLPFRPIAAMTDGTLGWEMMVHALISTGLVVAALAGCYSLNAGFSEMAADGVERRVRRLQRFRSGNASAAISNGSPVQATRSLKPFPWWRGAGPVAWQQAVAARRRMGRFIRLIVIIGATAACVALYVKIRFPESLTDTHRLAAIPIAMGVATYLGFLVTMSSQGGFSAPTRHLSWFQLIPINPMSLATGMLAGNLSVWVSIRLAIILPALAVTSFTWVESIAFLFAGIAMDVAMVSAINFVTATTNLRIMSQGPPDILQGGRAIVFMIVVMCVIMPTAMISSVAALVVGTATGFSWAACAFSAGLVTLAVQPVVWWYSGTIFLRRELATT